MNCAAVLRHGETLSNHIYFAGLRLQISPERLESVQRRSAKDMQYMPIILFTWLHYRGRNVPVLREP